MLKTSLSVLNFEYGKFTNLDIISESELRVRNMTQAKPILHS